MVAGQWYSGWFGQRVMNALTWAAVGSEWILVRLVAGEGGWPERVSGHNLTWAHRRAPGVAWLRLRREEGDDDMEECRPERYVCVRACVRVCAWVGECVLLGACGWMRTCTHE